MTTPNLPARETIHMPNKMRDDVVNYQHKNKIASKQEAFRQCIQRGLDADKKKGK